MLVVKWVYSTVVWMVVKLVATKGKYWEQWKVDYSVEKSVDRMVLKSADWKVGLLVHKLADMWVL